MSMHGGRVSQRASTESAEENEREGPLPKGATSSKDVPSPPQPSGLGPGWRLVASSAGVFADAYDLFAIDLVILILELQYGSQVISMENKSLMVGMMLAGIIVGQLGFGVVADWVGRRRAFVCTAGLTVAGALLSACVFRTASGPGLPVQLALCRLILGVGVGGEYPLSATVTAESAQSAEERGTSLTTVISMQGWGMLASALIAMAAVRLGAGLSLTWRLLLAFGALPALLAFCLRWQLHESSAFNEARESSRGSDRGRLRTPVHLVRDYWKILLGTSANWFLMNLSLYSLGSFKSQIVSEWFTQGIPDRDRVAEAAQFSCVTGCMAIAGFLAALLLINRLGRYWMQFLGFLALSLVFAALALLQFEAEARMWASMTLLCLIFFFLNLGPNTTTFIVPAEAFPTLARATCHGVSAASGKVGALVGTVVFPVAKESLGMDAVYAACCMAALCGAATTWLLTPRHTGLLCELERIRD